MLGAWAIIIGAHPAAAQSSITWLNTATDAGPTAGTFNFNAGANWFGGVAPGFGDTAVFGATTTPNISFSPAFTDIQGWMFNVGAAAYTFTNDQSVRFSGAGVVINGGSASITNNSSLEFVGASSAGSANIVNNSFLHFHDSSTAGNATINNTSLTVFFDTSTGGSAKFVNDNTGFSAIDFSRSIGPNSDGQVSAGSIAGMGKLFLGSTALTVGGNNLDSTFSGVISDCGTGTECYGYNMTTVTGGKLIKAGTGTLTLTGANTFTGDTVVNGGALTVNNGGSINNAPSVFVSSGDTIIAGVAGSTATMNVSGATSQITTQDLVVGKSGAGTFNLLNGATATTTAVYVGDQAGSVGTLTVDASTFINSSGGVIVGNSGAGTLNLRNGGTASVTAFNVANGGGAGTLNIDGTGSSLTSSASINYIGFGGTATVNITNGGALLSSSGDLYMGATSGTTANLNVNSGGAVTTNRLFLGDSSGSDATVTVSGTGSSLTGNNTASIGVNGTGTFNVRNGATASVNNFSVAAGGGIGTINIDGLGSSLTGTGGVGSGGNYIGFGGTGTVNVTNGGRLLSTDDLQMGSASGTTGNLNVSGGGEVTTNRFSVGATAGSHATVTVSGTGSSLTTLDTFAVGNDGDGAFNLLNGATATLGGLNVGGNPGGSGAMTIGPGAIANLTTSFGPVAFRLGSLGTLTYNISPAGTGRIDGSSAFLDGKLAFTGINAAAATYALIQTTGGITGTLLSDLTKTNPNINFGTLRNPNLRIVGNDLLLSVDANSLAAILQPGVTGTAKQIADAVDAALLAGVTLPAGFNGVFNLSGDALVAALKQLSGQSAAGAQQTASDASNSFMGAMFDPFASGRAPAGGGAAGFASEDNDDAMAYAPRRKFSKREREARNAVSTRNNLYDPRWSVWGSAYGGMTTTTGSAAAGTNDTTSRAFGFVTGADYNLTRDTTMGFALGGGGSNYGVAGNLGSGRAELFQAGLFARHTMGAAYISGGLGYTFQNVTTDRTVTIAGTDQLRATFNANTLSVRGEGGTRFATQVVGITPYAALQLTNIALPGYGETAISGANTFALNYAAQDTTIVRTELGARFDKSYAMQTAMLTLRGRAAWAHDEGNDRRVSAVFGSLPGSNFTINGAMPSKDLALVSAGAEMTWLNDVSLAGSFEGEFAERIRGYGGKGTVRYVW